MREHDCGCKTVWDDELNHPVYLHTCGLHRYQVPEGWLCVCRQRGKGKPCPAHKKTVLVGSHN